MGGSFRVKESSWEVLDESLGVKTLLVEALIWEFSYDEEFVIFFSRIIQSCFAKHIVFSLSPYYYGFGCEFVRVVWPFISGIRVGVPECVDRSPNVRQFAPGPWVG